MAGATSCVGVVPFACEDDAQCDRVEGALCFEAGCAAPDPNCDSGYRYAGDAARSERGACVGLPGTTSGTSSGTTSGTETLDSSGEGSTSSGVGETGATSSSTDEGTTGSTSNPGSSTDSGTTGCEPDCTCVEQLQVGNQHNCVVRDDGAVACWGRNNRGQAGVADPELQTINQPRLVDLEGNVAVEVATQFEHTCARMGDGTVWCWGRNLYGMVDPNVPMDVDLGPQPVANVTNATAIRVGLRSSCARHADDTLTCWGWESYNLLLTNEVGPGPHTSGPYTGLVDYAIGFYHGCMWSTEEVRCWGRNNWGQVSDPAGGSFAEPQPIALPSSPQSVGIGRNHGCAALEDGTLWCWGYNETNQVTEGEVAVAVPTPTQVEPPWEGSITRVFAQGSNTCVETDASELWCWGGLQGDWLGVDGIANNVPIWPPRRIDPYDELVGGTVDIRAGSSHFCTRIDTAEVYCWGNGSFWQIGPSAPATGAETVRVDPCDAL